MRWFLGSLLVIVVGIGLYVGSALVSLGGLADAARRGDGAEVLARTDVVRLRHSLVDQIVSSYLKQAGRDRQIKPLERLALNTYGASIADAMIAKMLTEQNLTAILNKGSIGLGGAEIAQVQSLTQIDTSRILEMLSRISLVKPVELFVRLGDPDSGGGVSLHFEGTGWKLSGVQLPAAAVDALARDLMKSKGKNG
jgi:Protein of unknown function (DUF2939)